jgi:hypothetical protein
MIEGRQGFLGIQITQQKLVPEGLQAHHEGLLEPDPRHRRCGAAEQPSRQPTFVNRFGRIDDHTQAPIPPLLRDVSSAASCMGYSTGTKATALFGKSTGLYVALS